MPGRSSVWGLGGPSTTAADWDYSATLYAADTVSPPSDHFVFASGNLCM